MRCITTSGLDRKKSQTSYNLHWRSISWWKHLKLNDWIHKIMTYSMMWTHHAFWSNICVLLVNRSEFLDFFGPHWLSLIRLIYLRLECFFMMSNTCVYSNSKQTLNYQQIAANPRNSSRCLQTRGLQLLPNNSGLYWGCVASSLFSRQDLRYEVHFCSVF